MSKPAPAPLRIRAKSLTVRFEHGEETGEVVIGVDDVRTWELWELEAFITEGLEHPDKVNRVETEPALERLFGGSE